LRLARPFGRLALVSVGQLLLGLSPLFRESINEQTSGLEHMMGKYIEFHIQC
jgi:hypothetical protein